MEKILRRLRNIQFIIPIGFLCSVLFVGIEVVKYKGFLKNHTGIYLWQYILFYLLIFLIYMFFCYRLKIKKITSLSFLTKWNTRLILPFSALVVVSLFIIEAYTYSNFIFSTLSVNHYAFLDLLLLSFFFWVATASKEILKDHWPNIVFFTFLLICFFLYVYYFDFFYYLSANMSLHEDDKFMEWLQVFILALGVGITAVLSYKNRGKGLIRLVYFGSILFFLILIGEEISWGERLFQIPYNVHVDNYQQEFNLHNQPVLNEITSLMYIFAFLYTLGSWRIGIIYESKRIIYGKIKPWWDIFCFKGNEIIFFFPTFIFNPYVAYTIIPGYPTILDLYYRYNIVPDMGAALNFLAQWKESFEVLFYLGLVVHFLQILINCSTKISSHKIKSNSIFCLAKKQLIL